MRERFRRSLRRFIFFVVPLVGALFFFSFLSKTDSSGGKHLLVLTERGMAGDTLLLRELKNRFAQAGFVVSTGDFDSSRLDEFIISNPGALFLTDRPVRSRSFALRKVDIRFAAVAVTGRNSDLSSITGSEFDRIAQREGIDYASAEKAVSRKKNSVEIIPYERLSLRVKPLAVDGVLPTLGGLKDGSYPKFYTCSLYMRGEGGASLPETLLGTLDGSWIERSFTIIAGGDVMLARGTGTSIEAHGIDHPFEELRSELVRHDVACANLESPISQRGRKFSPDKGIYFRADPRVIKALGASGLDFLSLANNHSLDWGVGAIEDTVDLLERAGIGHAGVGGTREEALEPAVFDLSGFSVAFVAYNDVYPFAVTDPEGSMVTLSLRGEGTEKEIKLLKEKYDILIVSVHAGKEYDRTHEENKAVVMRKLVEWGADAVFGHHPHVVQGVEVYRDRIIAYSLGNLIFDQSWSEETSQGLLLEVGFVNGVPVYLDPKSVTIRNAQASLDDGAAREGGGRGRTHGVD